MKIGTIGTSWITNHFISAAKEISGTEVYVSSRTEARAQEFAKENECGYVKNVDELYSKCDLVYVASPHYMHYQQSKDALLNGCHVIVEKPVTLNHNEWLELLEIANENNVHIIEAIKPTFNKLLDKVDVKPKDITDFRLDYCQRSSKLDGLANGVVATSLDGSIGGGALNDIGVYNVSVMLILFGEPDSVTSKYEFIDNGADITGEATFKYGEKEMTFAFSKGFNQEETNFIETKTSRIDFEGSVSSIREITIDGKQTMAATKLMDDQVAAIVEAIRTNDTNVITKWNDHSTKLSFWMDKLREQKEK